MRGRPPKPIEQRIREGKAGDRPLPEPMLVAGRPRHGELDEPPGHISDEAKAFWRPTLARLVEVAWWTGLTCPRWMLAVQYAPVRALRRVSRATSIAAAAASWRRIRRWRWSARPRSCS